jgi:alkaline phosphatase
MKTIMRFPRTVVLLTAALVLAAASAATAEMPRNVILLIGDGMGYEHVKAASIYLYGQQGRLSFESLPYQANVVTDPIQKPPTTLPAFLEAFSGYAAAPPASGPSTQPATRPTTRPWKKQPTDSAAAATAMATGRKVYNNVLSLELPGSGEPLKTILEIAKERGKATALLTTTFLGHATPAAFASHCEHRNFYASIECEMLEVKPTIMMGGASMLPLGLSATSAAQAGYAVCQSRGELAALPAAPGQYVCGIFARGFMAWENPADNAPQDDVEDPDLRKPLYDEAPHLSEMTAEMLRLIQNSSPNGFFAMIEGGMIDQAAHVNNAAGDVAETVEFDRAVQVVLRWARGRTDTLVLVTADHETGDLLVLGSNGPGLLPDMHYGSLDHTDSRVPLYGIGPGAEAIGGTMDNTDIFRLMLGEYCPAATTRPSAETCPAAAN